MEMADETMMDRKDEEEVQHNSHTVKQHAKTVRQKILGLCGFVLVAQVCLTGELGEMQIALGTD
jgi:hypothetical protein